MQTWELGSAACNLQFEYCLSSDAVGGGEALKLDCFGVVFRRGDARVRDLEVPDEKAEVKLLGLLFRAPLRLLL